jgi:hypothetical protein
MAQHRSLTSRENGSQPAPFHAQKAMSNRVHAAMDPVQLSPREPSLDWSSPNSHPYQLPTRNHPMLSRRQLSNGSIYSERSPFPIDRMGKGDFDIQMARLARHSPRCWSNRTYAWRAKCQFSVASQTKEAPARRYRLWL